MTVSQPSPPKRLRIGIDAHALESGLGGNETYLRCLLLSLRAHPEHDYLLYISHPGAEAVAQRLLPAATCRRVSANPLKRLGFDLPLASRRDSLDLMHLQYVAPLFPGCPISLLIHDLSYEHNPAWFKGSEVLRFRLTIPPSAAVAKVVLTISDYCREDIVSRLGLDPGKVVVTPNALPPHYEPASAEHVAALRQKLGLPKRYLLALGNLQPRKNITTLLQAWKQIQNHPELKDISLVITGKKAWLYDDILREAGDSHSDRVQFTGYLPEEDLPALYSGALLFVYPSLFEGFGLPPIEAMACGAPVIVGKNSALPEVCSDAVQYSDVTSALQLALDIQNLLLNPQERQRLAAAGISRAKSYTLQHLATPTLLAWEKIAASNANSISNP